LWAPDFGTENTPMSYKVPSALLPLISKPPLRPGEDPAQFFDYLHAIFSDFQPADTVDWVWSVQYGYASWDALWSRRLRASYIEGRYAFVLRHSVLSGLRLSPSEIGQYVSNPAKLRELNIDPDVLPATAIVLHLKALEKLDIIIERQERRCDRIVEQLEMRRAVFAARAREVAGRMREARLAICYTPDVVDVTEAEPDTVKETTDPMAQPQDQVAGPDQAVVLPEEAAPPLAPEQPDTDQGVTATLPASAGAENPPEAPATTGQESV
jgi:hypothetical protein